MTDSLADYETAPSGVHRCLASSARPRAPHAGSRYNCVDCGMHYVWVDGPFAGWQPTSEPDEPDAPISRHVRAHGRRGLQVKGGANASTDQAQ